MELAADIGYWIGIIMICITCAAGVFLSCLTFSGTWLVVLASAFAAFLSGPEYPGPWTVAAFTVVSLLVEIMIVEFLDRGCIGAQQFTFHNRPAWRCHRRLDFDDRLRMCGFRHTRLQEQKGGYQYGAAGNDHEYTSCVSDGLYGHIVDLRFGCARCLGMI